MNKYKCSRSEKPISKDINNPEMMDFGELDMAFKHDASGELEIVGNIALNDSDPYRSIVGQLTFLLLKRN